MKNPLRVSTALRSIASKIDRSKQPSRTLVMRGIRRVLAAVNSEMELVAIHVMFPSGMDFNEVVQRAKSLFPCKTGNFEVEQQETDWATGNLECDSGYYENADDSNEFGPDEAGVTVVWEKP